MKWYWVIVLALVAGAVALAESGLVAFPRASHWTGVAIAGLVLLSGGWMAFDGGRALVVGDYVTPRRGPHAGQLGTWAKLVQAVGIEPRSTAMKLIFFGYGLAYVGTMVAHLLGATWSSWGLPVVAVLGSWYWPFGTVIGIVVVALVAFPHA